MADLLFNVRNSFYLGAYNTVINEAADLDNLSETETIERDCFVYRAYIALGSYDVSLECSMAWKPIRESPRVSPTFFSAYSRAVGDQRN